MPPKVVEKFEVDYVQILDEQGNVVPGAIVPKLSDRVLQEKYEMMKFLRAFDNKALALQRQGRMGTYSEFKGQEAIQVGAMMSLEEKDWFFPTYRDSGAIIARGVAPESIFRYWSGDEEGQNFPPGVHVFPIAIPVASQIPHAVGGAWVLKHRNPGSIALVTIGDGGTSKADFYEGMNLAGVFNVPVVCLIQNNQYAITLPRGFQTASSTLAQKGLAFGIGGIQVDGNDLLAVYTVICKAADRARRGEGASLVECITYRLGHHTTATGDEPYRSEEEIDSRVKLKIDEAVRMFESFPRPSPNEMFRYTYGEMPSKLKGQEKYLSRFLENSTSQEAQTKRSSARSEAKSVEQI